MPIHDYRCDDCKAQFELLVRASTVPQCPACSSLKLEKLLSAIAPAGKSAGIIAAGRAQAAREGHLSNY
jgi:putative FmdB family regulatory protein